MPRKSLGGDGRSGTVSATFIDHAGQKAVSAYWGRAPSPGAPILPPLWSFQFYVTYGATADSDPDLPKQLLAVSMRATIDVCPIRLDVNFLPGADPERCMQHYRDEKAARVQAGAPLLVTDPYQEYSKFSFLVMIEHAEWEFLGGTTVVFDGDEPDDPEHPEQTRKETVDRNVEWGDASNPNVRPSAKAPLGQTMHYLGSTPAWDEGNELYERQLEQGRSSWD
jgi:hypothetical protein